jgi:chlorinating enzyme
MQDKNQNSQEYVVKDVHENQMSAYPNLVRDLRYSPTSLDGDSALSVKDRAMFNRNGYITGLKGLEESEVKRVREKFESLLSVEMEAGRGSYTMDGWQHKVAFIHDLVCSPKILDAVEALIGPNILCWGTHFFCKLPGDGKRVPWHQDASFWPLTPSRCVTAWLAIDDAAVENGCMQVVPQSHLHGQIAFRKSEDDGAAVLNQTVDSVDLYGAPPDPG